MESLGGPSTLLGNLLSTLSLVLEISGFGMLLINFVQDSVVGHDLLYKQGRDTSSKETDEHVVVCDADASNITLKHADIAFE